MLGSGFAFSMLPVLRRLHPTGSAEGEAALRRHVEHFNAHPYLSSVALGAVVRLESDGADAETVRRFKVAVRGPLGSLGDSFVWATWLPAVSLLGLALYWAGAPTWVVVTAFLVLYNVVHLALRTWGFRVGLAEGREVGKRLAQADLSGRTARLEPWVAGLLGIVAGVLLGGPTALSGAGALWLALGTIAFVVGLIVGHRAWRPAAIAVVVAIAVTAWVGVLR